MFFIKSFEKHFERSKFASILQKKFKNLWSEIQEKLKKINTKVIFNDSWVCNRRFARSL